MTEQELLNKTVAKQLSQRAVDLSDIRHMFTGEFELDLWTKYENYDDLFIAPSQQSEYDIVENKMRVWVELNCEGYVLFEGDMRFVFLNETDRTTFKLVWG